MRDANRAEDVVQETLLAAIEGSERYAGRASVKTWLTGILKHKIIDLFRKQSRETQVPDTPEGELLKLSKYFFLASSNIRFF